MKRKLGVSSGIAGQDERAALGLFVVTMALKTPLPAASAESDAPLEEIVVTAEHRQESLQDTPAHVDAATAAESEE